MLDGRPRGRLATASPRDPGWQALLDDVLARPPARTAVLGALQAPLTTSQRRRLDRLWHDAVVAGEAHDRPHG